MTRRSVGLVVGIAGLAGCGSGAGTAGDEIVEVGPAVAMAWRVSAEDDVGQGDSWVHDVDGRGSGREWPPGATDVYDLMERGGW